MGGPGHGERKRVRNKTREKVNMPSTTATRSHMRRDTPVGGEQGDQRGPEGGGNVPKKVRGAEDWLSSPTLTSLSMARGLAAVPRGGAGG